MQKPKERSNVCIERKGKGCVWLIFLDAVLYQRLVSFKTFIVFEGYQVFGAIDNIVVHLSFIPAESFSIVHSFVESFKITINSSEVPR